jgi:glutamate dehydrogenase (NADP+)
VYISEQMLKTRGEDFRGKTCLISGSGNVAQYTVEKLIEYGAKCLTLSDSEGTIYDRDGIDTEKLAWVMDLKTNRRGRIREYTTKFRSAEYFEGRKPWHIPAQCAFPSATQNEISGEDAAELIKNGCYVIGEGANMPTMPEGVEHFREAKILYGPGKAANAGGVATSGLEMAQNSMRISWSREEVDHRLKMIMTSIHDVAFETSKEYGSPGDYVTGANIAGFVKVADAMLAQGLV